MQSRCQFVIMKEVMKRNIITVFIGIVLAIFVVTPSVSAATPTPTPTPTILPTPTINGSSSDAIDIPNGIPNQQIDNSYDPEVIPITPTPNASSTYTIPPLNPPMDDFKIPSMDSVSQWLMRTLPYMTAKQIKDKVLVHDDNLFVSGKVKKCVWIAGVLVYEKQGDVYETNLVKYLADLLSSNRLLASHLVRYSVTPVEEKYDLNGPAYRIDSTDLPCELPGKGTPQDPPKIIGLKKGFSIAGFIKNLLNSLNPAVEKVVSKQQTAEAERVHCTLDGCVTDNEDIDLAYVTKNPKNPPDEIARLQKSGGVVDSGFRAIFMDTKKGKVPHGQEPNFTDTNTLKTKQMENSANLIKCSLIPPKQRNVLGLTTENCSDFVTTLPASTTGSCDIQLSDLTVNSSCKLKNNTKGLPANLITAIEAAASAYNVPPALMVGVIFGEGRLETGSLYFNSSEVEKYLTSCTPLPNCDPNGAVSDNIVPFIKEYWANLADAVKVVDPNRTPNACNLLDGIFALAKDLSKNQYGAPAFAGKKCFGIPLNSGSGGSSSCSWSDNAAETAIRVWELGTKWDLTTQCATVVGSCLSGISTTCPGDDLLTCDTVQSPKYPRSHNGCIWEVYKSN